MGTYVYRAYCVCDALLYVGITDGVPLRMQQHERGSVWFEMIGRIEWNWHSNRSEALSIEASLIKDLNPPYNIQHRSNELLIELPWPHCGVSRWLLFQKYAQALISIDPQQLATAEADLDQVRGLLDQLTGWCEGMRKLFG